MGTENKKQKENVEKVTGKDCHLFFSEDYLRGRYFNGSKGFPPFRTSKSSFGRLVSDMPISAIFWPLETSSPSLTKIDLLPYLDFNINQCLEYAKQVNPELDIFQVSSVTGEGLSAWYGWLKNHFVIH